ncbi:hypothetical protein BHE74_00016078 [Ensete ventricosum]|nr:hypothetical protein BHE74_00016078 [Ensete ventricosum]
MEVYPATLAGSSFGSHDVANRTGDGGASKPLFLPFEHSDALENRSRTGQNATWHRTYDGPVPRFNAQWREARMRSTWR